MHDMIRVSRFGRDCHECLIALVAAAKASDPLAPVTVVVPSQYAGLSLRRVLAAGSGLINVRFMVLARLAEYLGGPALAVQGKAPRSRMVEMAAIRQVAHGMRRAPLGGLADHPKLHESLRRTFHDLARLPESGLAQLEATDSLRGQLVDWYRRYCDVLDAYYDSEDMARAAAAAVESGAAGSALRDLGSIISYLVPSFSPGERALVAALNKRRLCSIVLGLTGDGEVDASAFNLAKEFGGSSGPATSETSIDRPKPTHLLIASDAHEEVRWVVRHVMRRAEQSTPFHRIAILYGQSDPYASLVPDQLGFAGAPVSGPDPTPLRETPAGKLLLYLLEMLHTGFARKDVMRWLGETPVRTGADQVIVSHELARWDAISRELGITAGADQWQDRLGMRIAALRDKITEIDGLENASPGRLSWLESTRDSAGRLKRFMLDVTSIQAPPSGSPWSTFSKWASSLLRRFASDPAEWPLAHRASYERVASIVDDLRALDHLSALGTSIEAFRQALSEELGAPSGRTGQTGIGVFVAPVGDCLGMDFDAVYIVGVAEGALPAGVADDPVLPDEVRRGLGDPDTLPLRGARRLQERREFLAAVSAGREAVLSYAIADAGRGGQYPSPWFLEEASRLQGSRLSTAELGRLERRPWLSWVRSLQHGLAYVATISPTDSHDRDMSSLSAWRGTGHPMDQHYLLSHVPVLARAVAMEHARKGNGLSEWDGKVPLLKGTREAGSQVKPVSPTALESWATCPFRYFLSHVLRIEAAESPEELLTIDAMERGSLLHRVLERFMRESLVQGKMPGFGEPWESWHERLLIDIAEDEFVQVEGRGITGRRVFWEATQKEMRRDLGAFLEEDSRWRGEEHSRPLWIERQFGMKDEDSLPSVELAMPDGLQVAFHGRMDRLDQCKTAPALPAKFIVIDYKFGSAYPFIDMKDDPLGGGRHLQLPVYGLAARAGLGTGAAVEALYWFATAKGGFEQKGVNLAEVECRFRDLTSTITRMIGLGLFPANPGTEDRDNCKFCDFKRVCPPDRDMAWERKSQAPELKPYLALSQGAPDEGAEE